MRAAPALVCSRCTGGSPATSTSPALMPASTRYGTVQYTTLQSSTRHSSMQYSTVQHIRHSAEQDRTVQCSTVELLLSPQRLSFWMSLCASHFQVIPCTHGTPCSSVLHRRRTWRTMGTPCHITEQHSTMQCTEVQYSTLQTHGTPCSLPVPSVPLGNSAAASRGVRCAVLSDVRVLFCGPCLWFFFSFCAVQAFAMFVVFFLSAVFHEVRGARPCHSTRATHTKAPESHAIHALTQKEPLQLKAAMAASESSV